jgi:hypothetical protein
MIKKGRICPNVEVKLIPSKLCLLEEERLKIFYCSFCLSVIIKSLMGPDKEKNLDYIS